MREALYSQSTVTSYLASARSTLLLPPIPLPNQPPPLPPIPLPLALPLALAFPLPLEPPPPIPRWEAEKKAGTGLFVDLAGRADGGCDCDEP
jgi:hypothetical protein